MIAVGLLLGIGVLLMVAERPLVAGPRVPDVGERRRVRGVSGSRVAPGPLDVAHLVERLATVVASGVAPRRAFTAVAEVSPAGPLRALASAVGDGADPRRAAGRRLARSGEVSALGAALELCERTGSPTGPLLLTLADALRDVADAQLARRSAFAGPLSTARILLCLPPAGIALGMLLGADPLGTLVTGQGRMLLLGGIALTLIGWAWMHRLVRSARADGPTGVDTSIVLDLVAGPLSAGAPPARALVEVAAALGDDPSAAPLRRAGLALEAGTATSVALAHLEGGLVPLREAALVGSSTGADLVALLRAGGADARRGRAREAEAAAARLAVRLVLPTGLTLLPAFVLLGIIPSVVSLLGGSFGEMT